MPIELLAAKKVSKAYDGVQALRNASLSLQAGEVHALMGENGAGKSTLGKIVAGVVQPDSGSIQFDGQPVTLRNPLYAQRLGVAMIHQELDLFPNLSVAENIAIGNAEFREGALVSFNKLRQFAGEFLRQVGLRVSPDSLVSSLSIGDMQLVMIARALSTRARILIMDEPTSSLFHDSVERLFQLIRELKARGVAILYVSHKMDEIFRICDRMTVMRDGSTIGTREKDRTTPNELIGMMVGRPWKAGEHKSGKVADTLMQVAGLSTGKLRNVSFELAYGEVLGIAGLVGAGRSELGLALSGLDDWHAGEIKLRGQAIRPRSVKEAHDLGIRLLAEDRKLDGLMMHLTVVENGTIADLSRFAPGGFVRPRLEAEALQPLFQRLALKSHSGNASVSTLSGGNQQKVLLARALLADPEVLFLDDPTRGIDIGAKEDIYSLIAELAARGKGVLFVSSELPELLRCCDRILVMRAGQLVAALDTDATNQEEIMSYAATDAADQTGARLWLN